ncbi:MAG TPA: SIS domain-containing protein [Dongiaceae bacterium]|nr:SIS domain-containing protein [Dongiaceae bacterium]
MVPGNQAYFDHYFSALDSKIRSLNPRLLDQCVELIRATHLSGKKLIIAGNGGSAAMASHLCVDFLKTTGIRAMNFNEADLITCFANDYGYPHWVEKALEAYTDKGDLVILISSSGASPNMVNAATKARALGLGIITVTGFAADNPLRSMGDLNLWVDSSQYNIVEMTHHVWLLSVIDYLALHRESLG